MNIRSISLIQTDLDEDILEIRANNHQPFKPKNISKVITNVRNAIEREDIQYGKVRKRGENIYLVLSERAEANLPKRTTNGGTRVNPKLLTTKIVKAKVGA